MSKKILSTLLVTAIFCGCSSKKINSANPLSDPDNKGGWAIYDQMTDEFEGAELDSSKWHNYNPDWKGRAPAMFDSNNVVVKDGKLYLYLRNEPNKTVLNNLSIGLAGNNNSPDADGFSGFTSAAVKSKEPVKYGYFEIKAKSMKVNACNAFWFYNRGLDWWNEIDVFEIVGSKGFEKTVNMNMHVFRDPTSNHHFEKHDEYHHTENLADNLHVYGVEWDEQTIKWYFDSKLIRTLENNYCHDPLHLNLDVETMPDWVGLPDPNTLPAEYVIEYVRAWKKR